MSDELKDHTPTPAAVPAPGGNSGIHIGGSVTGSAVVQGNNNATSVYAQIAPLPPAESVNLKDEIAAIKAVLATLQIPDQRQARNEAENAEIEAEKPEPDKAAVGGAMERWLGYAAKAEGFAKVVEVIKPNVVKIAGWLGANHEKLLQMVGLASGTQ